MSDFKDIAALKLWMRGRHPKIRAHREEDEEWYNEGLDLLEAGRVGLAENKFQKLILSQPKHFDGYEGLAQVYVKTDRRNEARLLMDYALELAAVFIAEDSLSPETFERMQKFRQELS